MGFVVGVVPLGAGRELDLVDLVGLGLGLGLGVRVGVGVRGWGEG